jgi:hypothetical protein
MPWKGVKRKSAGMSPAPVAAVASTRNAGAIPPLYSGTALRLAIQKSHQRFKRSRSGSNFKKPTASEGLAISGRPCQWISRDISLSRSAPSVRSVGEDHGARGHVVAPVGHAGPGAAGRVRGRARVGPLPREVRRLARRRRPGIAPLGQARVGGDVRDADETALVVHPVGADEGAAGVRTRARPTAVSGTPRGGRRRASPSRGAGGHGRTRTVWSPGPSDGDGVRSDTPRRHGARDGEGRAGEGGEPSRGPGISPRMRC